MHVHFLGIGGSGASAAAAIAQAQGFEVSGCDNNSNTEFTHLLGNTEIYHGHSASHLGGGKLDILAITPAILSYDPDNEEIMAAKEAGIEVVTWQQFMGKFLEQNKFVIAVCGTHGKSTTAAMIGIMMEEAGLDPTVELGAIVSNWGANFRVGKSKYFITEADEYNNNFLVSHPDIAVVTNIEWDHPEFFQDFSKYQASFNKFFAQSKKVIKNPDPAVIDFELQVPGEFNKQNAAAAFTVGLELGINPKTIKKSLANFRGIARRFELVGELNGAQIYSDFGHHPTEIRVTLEAIKEKFPSKRLWVIFQPHMFSRTKALFADFVHVFQQAKVGGIAILDIYPSREVDTGLVTSQELVSAINRPQVKYLAQDSLQDWINHHLAEGKKQDVFLFLGAGDVDRIARKLASANASL